ncbi:hypothetical protein H6P81_010373 [Aristolochia fimbriata]|uniref:DUF659 domain-containing protein n=1 Tax=Aristolochia fimbriata TaxID=158543 RepID=A0AAV7ET18_ARIFI|nr:hypothetical protein H6P81_010373 [Aristolochia fimbriata]
MRADHVHLGYLHQLAQRALEGGSRSSRICSSVGSKSIPQLERQPTLDPYLTSAFHRKPKHKTLTHVWKSRIVKNFYQMVVMYFYYTPTARSKGTVFLKSVDASGVMKDSQYLFKLMDEVGPQYIVHIVTNNASNYKSIGKMIQAKYKSIYRSPCVAHCMDLVIKDICKLKGPRQAITFASKTTKFIYNHGQMLELIRGGDLRTLFASNEWTSIHSRFPSRDLKRKGKDVESLVFDDNFWKKVDKAILLMSPLVKVLKFIDELSVKELSVEVLSVKELSVKELSVEVLSVKELSVKELSVKELSVKELSVKEPSVEVLSVKELSVKELSVKELSVKELTVEHLSVKELSVKELSVKALSVK